MKIHVFSAAFFNKFVYFAILFLGNRSRKIRKITAKKKNADLGEIERAKNPKKVKGGRKKAVKDPSYDPKKRQGVIVKAIKIKFHNSLTIQHGVGQGLKDLNSNKRKLAKARRMIEDLEKEIKVNIQFTTNLLIFERNLVFVAHFIENHYYFTLRESLWG